MLLYRCPGCNSQFKIHDPPVRERCRYHETPHHEIEKSYIDILSVLIDSGRTRASLREEAHEWSALHEDVLDRLVDIGRIEEFDHESLPEPSLRLLTPSEWLESKRAPVFSDELMTIYEQGTRPGCHDNGVFALVAYYKDMGFSWDDTRDIMLEWFEDSGAWDAGGWEETSPEEVLRNKRHVFDGDYGWKNKAKAAARARRNH